MEGKKFIHTVRVVKAIPGVLEKGGIYRLEELKYQFPFLDFDNEEYFETQYDDKYKRGDKVRFTGKEISYGENRGLSKKVVYVVMSAKHQIKNSLLYTSYEVSARDSGFDTKTYTIKECELESAESKWIVSFSSPRNTDKPAIHELDYFAWKNKICGTWKEVFVFDTFQEAERVANMFSRNTVEHIVDSVEAVNNNNNDIRFIRKKL